FPAANRPPLLLDMSTSTVAMGKVMSARDADQKIPLGWGLDADGRDTTDPKKLATLLPLGGPKGCGLSFMIQCLCSLIIGNPIIPPAVAAGGKLDAPYINGIAIAVDLAAFGDRERILGESDRLARLIAGLAPADGVERIYLPGDSNVCATAFPYREALGRGSSPAPRLLKCRHPEASAPRGLSPFEKRLNTFAAFGRGAGVCDAARGQCLQRVIDRAKGDFGNESFRTRLRLRASCEQPSNQALESAVETSLGNDLVHQSQSACVGCRERLASQKVPASGSGADRRDHIGADRRWREADAHFGD